MRDMTIERLQTPRPPLPGRDEEYIDIQGHLRVPVADSIERGPEREGWEQFFVNVNLAHPIQKVCIYKRVKEDNSADS